MQMVRKKDLKGDWEKATGNKLNIYIYNQKAACIIWNFSQNVLNNCWSLLLVSEYIFYNFEWILRPVNLIRKVNISVLPGIYFRIIFGCI